MGIPWTYEEDRQLLLTVPSFRRADGRMDWAKVQKKKFPKRSREDLRCRYRHLMMMEQRKAATRARLAGHTPLPDATATAAAMPSSSQQPEQVGLNTQKPVVRSLVPGVLPMPLVPLVKAPLETMQMMETMRMAMDQTTNMITERIGQLQQRIDRLQQVIGRKRKRNEEVEENQIDDVNGMDPEDNDGQLVTVTPLPLPPSSSQQHALLSSPESPSLPTITATSSATSTPTTTGGLVPLPTTFAHASVPPYHDQLTQLTHLVRDHQFTISVLTRERNECFEMTRKLVQEKAFLQEQLLKNYQLQMNQAPSPSQMQVLPVLDAIALVEQTQLQLLEAYGIPTNDKDQSFETCFKLLQPFYLAFFGQSMEYTAFASDCEDLLVHLRRFHALVRPHSSQSTTFASILQLCQSIHGRLQLLLQKENIGRVVEKHTISQALHGLRSLNETSQESSSTSTTEAPSAIANEAPPLQQEP